MAPEPDTDFAFEDEKNAQVFNWLKARWKGDRKCPICLSRQWNVNRDAAMLPIKTDDSAGKKKFFPFLVINCNVCGYTFLMNEVVMGIAAPRRSGGAGDEEKEQEETTGGG